MGVVETLGAEAHESHILHIFTMAMLMDFIL
jgi:hypothetical protein